MSEYKLIVIETDGETETQDKYNNTSYSYFEGAFEAMDQALEENINLSATIVEITS